MLSEVFQLFSNKLFKMGDWLMQGGIMGMGDNEEINISGLECWPRKQTTNSYYPDRQHIANVKIEIVLFHFSNFASIHAEVLSRCKAKGNSFNVISLYLAHHKS